MSIAKAKVSKQWLYWVAIPGIVAVSLVVTFSVPRFGIPMAWQVVVWGLVMVVTVMSGGVLFLSFKKVIQRTLWRVLADEGCPCCQSCGYDLTGNVSGRCSECGVDV